MHVSLLRNRCNLILRAVLADVDLRPSSLIGITPFDPPPEHITVLRDLLSSAFHKLIIHILLMTLSPLCVGVLCFCDNRSPNTLFGWGVESSLLPAICHENSLLPVFSRMLLGVVPELSHYFP